MVGVRNWSADTVNLDISTLLNFAHCYISTLLYLHAAIFPCINPEAPSNLRELRVFCFLCQFNVLPTLGSSFQTDVNFEVNSLSPMIIQIFTYIISMHI